MKSKLLIMLTLSSLFSMSAIAYDSDYPTVCASAFNEAIDYKGTSLQDEKWHIFTSCVDAVTEGEDRIEVKDELQEKEPFCYSLTGAFIGKDDKSCTVPNWYKWRR